MFDRFTTIYEIMTSQDPIAREQARLSRAKALAISAKLSMLTRALGDGDSEAIMRYQSELAQFQRVVDAATQPYLANGDGVPAAPAWTVVEQKHEALPAAPASADIPCYGISSSTLSACYVYLTQNLPDEGNHEPEWMLAMTGIYLPDRHFRSLEQLIEIRMNHQSAARASFDMDAFMKVARTLDKHGQALHAIIHSHRFSGPPVPSGVDWKLQKILDQGRFPTIQAVFSEDAFVRFFANRNRPFMIEISGKGVKTINESEHLYQITEFTTMPSPLHDGDGG